MLDAIAGTLKKIGLLSAGRILGFAGDIVYPPKCLKCGDYLEPGNREPAGAGLHFCRECLERHGFFLLEPPFCSRCAKPFSGSSGTHVCENCLKEPPAVGKVRAATQYSGIMTTAVPLFKYSAKLSLAEFFEQLMFQCFKQYFLDSRIDIILPVPLHRRKMRARGFNQAYLLVRNFKKFHKKAYPGTAPWQVDVTSLERVVDTQAQTGFDIKKRRKNLKNAFALADASKIEDRRILLVDDVFTTGATCNEAARQLLKNGARQVDALILARA